MLYSAPQNAKFRYDFVYHTDYYTSLCVYLNCSRDLNLAWKRFFSPTLVLLSSFSAFIWLT